MPCEQALEEMRGGWGRDEDEQDESVDVHGVLAGHGYGPGFEDLEESDRAGLWLREWGLFGGPDEES